VGRWPYKPTTIENNVSYILGQKPSGYANATTDNNKIANYSKHAQIIQY